MKKTVLTVLLAILSITFCEAQSIQDERYRNLIVSAENNFKQQKYEAAKQDYIEARKIKPENAGFINQKIVEIDKKIQELKDAKVREKERLELEYLDVIASAENNVEQQKYELAKQNYQKAIKLKPENAASINQKIAEIDDILLQIERRRAEELEGFYQSAMSSAERNYSQQKYEQAKQDYVKALELKPENATSINKKIAEIDDKLLEIKKQREKEELDRNYYNTMESARINFNQQKYAQAKKDYQKALDLKPENAYSINQEIAKIDKILLENERRAKMLFAKGKKVSYLYNDERVLNKNEVQNLMSKYPEALRLYNKGLKNIKTGNTLMTIGVLGGGAGAIFIFAGKGNEKTIGVVTTVIGGGIFVIGGITRLSGNSAIRKSVDEYNNRLNDKYSSANVELKLNISCNSIGLTLDF